MNKNRNKAMIKFIVLLIFSIIVLYPLVWMIMSSFKEESTIFSNLGILLEKDFALDVPRFFLEYAKDYQVFVLQGPFNIVDRNKLVWNVDNPENKIEFAQGVIENLNQE